MLDSGVQKWHHFWFTLKKGWHPYGPGKARIWPILRVRILSIISKGVWCDLVMSRSKRFMGIIVQYFTLQLTNLNKAEISIDIMLVYLNIFSSQHDNQSEEYFSLQIFWSCDKRFYNVPWKSHPRLTKMWKCNGSLSQWRADDEPSSSNLIQNGYSS